MLKIKNNVDLKELEKFGFDLSASSKFGNHNFEDRFIDDNYGYIISGNIYIYDRNDFREENYLKIYIDKVEEQDLNKLYDLIKANLVEKVEDKGE